MSFIKSERLCDFTVSFDQDKFCFVSLSVCMFDTVTSSVEPTLPSTENDRLYHNLKSPVLLSVPCRVLGFEWTHIP